MVDDGDFKPLLKVFKKKTMFPMAQKRFFDRQKNLKKNWRLIKTSKRFRVKLRIWNDFYKKLILI